MMRQENKYINYIFIILIAVALNVIYIFCNKSTLLNFCLLKDIFNSLFKLHLSITDAVPIYRT